jgi:hypothetical protein
MPLAKPEDSFHGRFFHFKAFDFAEAEDPCNKVLEKMRNSNYILTSDWRYQIHDKI